MTALDRIREDGVVAIVRESSPGSAADAVARLVAAGLHALEVSLVTPGALDVVAEAIARAPVGVSIGFGTVMTAAEARSAAAVGASFIVTPALDSEVVRVAIDHGMDVLPGVMTPTEAVQAVRAGATAVKIFPASLWKPSALRDVRAAMPWLEAVPTGGVAFDEAGQWIRAGAIAVGLGSALTRGDDLTERIARLRVDVARSRRGDG